MTETDTTAALGGGEMVLAHAGWFALAEQATVAAVAGALEAGATTVSVRVELKHLAPSPVLAKLDVEGALESVVGGRLLVAARLSDGNPPVATGLITRVVVDTAAFLRDADANVGPPGGQAIGWWPIRQLVRRLTWSTA